MGGAPLQAPRRVWLAVKPPIKRQAPEQTAPGGGGAVGQVDGANHAWFACAEKQGTSSDPQRL